MGRPKGVLNDDSYIDTGCEASSSCLACPLAVCRHDNPAAYYQVQRQARDLEKVQIIYGESLTVAEAAIRFKVTQRTVFKILERYAEENHERDVNISNHK